jgi:hypothetical protein
LYGKGNDSTGVFFSNRDNIARTNLKYDKLGKKINTGKTSSVCSKSQRASSTKQSGVLEKLCAVRCCAVAVRTQKISTEAAVRSYCSVNFIS